MISWMSLNFGRIWTQTTVLDFLERIKIPPYTYSNIGVSTFSRLFSYLRIIQNIFMTYLLSLR